MQDLTYQKCLLGDFLARWTRVTLFKKPIIAAVNGFAVRIILSFFSYELQSTVMNVHVTGINFVKLALRPKVLSNLLFLFK